jgi:oxygen-independent coproporphyrinogen-3 oxidase
LYVHLPFCKACCRYCDFARETYSPARAAMYLRALETELRARAAGLAPRTIYLGGGTPTSLSYEELRELLALLQRHLDFSRAEEWTCEANPGTVDAAKLELLRSAGVNRLSLGVQSFQPRLLKLLGRIHDAAQARESFALARAAGFRNLSLDLMHSIPTQTREELDRDLDAALALDPEHLSAYGLTLEPETALAEAVARGELAELPEEEAAVQYHQVRERLARAGLLQYEISNYAKVHFECRHNLGYWRNEPYLGLGPAAAGFLAGERTVNERKLDQYCAALERFGRRGEARVPRTPWPWVAERERLEPEAAAREALILELRLRAGVEPSEFQRRWGLDLEKRFAAELARFAQLGMMERTATGRRRLTDRALHVSNEVLRELV